MPKKSIQKNLSTILLSAVISVIATVGILYFYNKSFVEPLAADKIGSLVIDAGLGIQTDMPVTAEKSKQYLPEMRLSLPYKESSDQLSYNYQNTGKPNGVKQYAVIGYNNNLAYANVRNAQTLDEVFDAVPSAGECTRLYVLSYSPDLKDSYVDSENYELIKSVSLKRGQQVYVFKLKKSCEAVSGFSSEQQKTVEKILSSANSY